MLGIPVITFSGINLDSRELSSVLLPYHLTVHLTLHTMDSINKQQEEKNHEDLQGAAAKGRIKDMAKDSSCFFCTDFKNGDAFATRPMAVQDIDEDGNLWFLSANDSKKNKEIAIDASVQLLFQGSSYSEFLTLFGSAEVVLDKDRIRELWQPILKTWFTEGIDDPRITAIILYYQ